MYHLAWIVPLVFLIFYLASPRYRGDIAESRVRRVLAAGLDANRYTILNDVLLPAGGGSVHIDHVVISRHGIFVIESQYAVGWVSGTPVQDRWKQSTLLRTIRLDNPVHKNRSQALAVQQLLDYPSRVVHGIVVMAGQKGFKTDTPEYVLSPDKLIAFIRKKGQLLLEPEQAARATSSINSSALKDRKAWFSDRIVLLRLFLVAVLLAGLYLAFGDDLSRAAEGFKQGMEQREAPGNFHADGTPKTETELWEDSLRCAWSADTGRCACYEPKGSRVEIETAKCRSLAERGSVLKQ